MSVTMTRLNTSRVGEDTQTLLTCRYIAQCTLKLELFNMKPLQAATVLAECS